MQLLTIEQKDQLVQIVTEEFGSDLPLESFVEALLSLLDDVPGFETAQQSTVNKLNQQLWNQYHG